MAHKTGALAPRDLERVVVDTTVQPKAIAHPTDARLCHRALQKLVDLAKRHGVPLRQSYRRSPSARRSWSAGTAMPISSSGHGASSNFAHSAGPTDPRHPPQDRRKRGAEGALRQSSRPGGAGTLPGSSPARPQGVCAARPRGRMHRQGESPSAVRVRVQSVDRHPGHQAQGAGNSCCMPKRCTATRSMATLSAR